MVTKTFTYDGRRYYVRGKNEREAKRKLAERKAELKTAPKMALKTMTLDEWFELYMRTYKPDISQSTDKLYRGLYKNALRGDFGPLSLSSATPLDVQKILNATSDKSHSYIHKCHILLTDIYSKAVDNGLLDKSPCRGLVVPQGTCSERRALTESERQLFLSVCNNGKNSGLFCKIIYYCGLRPSEVARIEGGDYARGVLHVRGTKSKASTRDVPVPSALILPKLPKGQLLFHTVSGYPIDKKRIEMYWASIKRSMNIALGAPMYRNAITESLVAPDLTMYCLRHDYCTRLQEAGVPIDVARRLMGHSSIEVTSRIYTHDNPASFDRAAELIERHSKTVK